MITAPVDTSYMTTTNKVVSQVEVQKLLQNDASHAYKHILLRNHIERIIAKNERMGVTTGVSIMDLQSQQSIVGHNLDEEQFAASINKIPVAALVLRDLRNGTLKFDQVLTWTEADKRSGEGVFDQTGAPLQGTVKDVLFDLLNPSGNTAVRILVNQGLGGAATVNGRISSELQLPHTYLQPVDANRFYLGNSTPRDAMRAMQVLLSVNDTYGQFVRSAMATNIYNDYGVRSQLAGNNYIVLSNKVGILDDTEGNNRHDVGIIYNISTNKSYGYAFMNTAPGAAYGAATAQAGVSLADMGDSLLRAAGDKPTKQQAKGKALPALNGEQRIRY